MGTKDIHELRAALAAELRALPEPPALVFLEDGDPCGWPPDTAYLALDAIKARDALLRKFAALLGITSGGAGRKPSGGS